MTGAYRFVVTPGTDTIASVQASLFARSHIRRLGIAPLTSMFWHAENSETDFGDFRPRVHDSDGLLMHTGNGEWIWRPLRNPMHIETSAFQDRNPRGFGLLQRERDFGAYQDLEAHYEQRPSAWVEPVGDWGPGSVVLIEMPSDQETNDNIVAFWQPQQSPNPGEPLELAYRLHWYADDPTLPPSSRTLATRVGAIRDSEATRFVIDFGQGELAKLPPGAVVTANVSASPGGVVSDVVTQRNEYTHGWRVAFRLGTDGCRETGRVALLSCDRRSRIDGDLELPMDPLKQDADRAITSRRRRTTAHPWADAYLRAHGIEDATLRAEIVGTIVARAESRTPGEDLEDANARVMEEAQEFLDERLASFVGGFAPGQEALAGTPRILARGRPHAVPLRAARPVDGARRAALPDADRARAAERRRWCEPRWCRGPRTTRRRASTPPPRAGCASSCARCAWPWSRAIREQGLSELEQDRASHERSCLDASDASTPSTRAPHAAGGACCRCWCSRRRRWPRA